MSRIHAGSGAGGSPWGRRGIPRLHTVVVLGLLVAGGLVSAAGRSGGAQGAGPGGADSRAGGRPPAADTVTAALVARGRLVFEGKDGGAICATCHGADARGVRGLGPDLSDTTWLHGDGGLAFIREIIRTGVARPRESGGMMPPFGGVPLQPAQLEAVAAYVWSLSHPVAGAPPAG